MNGSRVIGPAIGGLAFHFVGPAWVFAGNAVTYLFVVAALLMVSLPAATRARVPSSRWRELTAGVRLARTDRVVGRCLATVFVFSLLSLAFLGQLPVVASQSLHIDPKSASYGILYACFGTGALLGAISIGTVFAQRSKAQIVRVCLVGYAFALALFAELRWAAPAYGVIVVVGMFYFAFITSLNTVLQSELDDAVRGRVMALWIMGFGGTVAVGNLIAGPVVAALGVSDVLLFGAGVALALAWFADVRRRDSGLLTGGAFSPGVA
jgi:predicted MFS family arabinose efflux permease